MLRNKFANKFTQISNAVLNDNELTLEEKGLFCYLFSKPDCWEFHYNAMKKELKEKSNDTIRRVLTSLVEKGYITKNQKNKTESGKFGGIDIEFTDKSFRLAETKNAESVNTPHGANADSIELVPNNNNSINNIDNNNKDLISIDKTPKRFIPPTIEEIENFCKQENIDVDAKKFFYWNDAKGWMIGKNKMKNWKSAVRTWERKKETQSVANEFLELGRK